MKQTKGPGIDGNRGKPHLVKGPIKPYKGNLTKGPGIDGRGAPMFGEDLPTGGRPRFGVAKPAPEGMVSIMPFPGDGVTPFPEDRKQMTRPEKIEKFGRPTVKPPRKGPPKKRGGTAKGKSIFGKVGAGLGAAAALGAGAAAAYGANKLSTSPDGIRESDRLGRHTDHGEFKAWDPYRDIGF
jgi:hypothetical protein